MPELPEVETIRRQLEKEILGAEIAAIEVREGKIFVGDSKRIQGDAIVAIKRVGKYLFVYLKSKRGLIIHLKMTGRLILEQKNPPTLKASEGHGKNIEYRGLDYEVAPHTRVVVDLDDGRKVFYWDTRKFGYLRLVEDIETEFVKLGKKLGPEPWNITNSELLRKFKRTGRTVKEAILDQSFLTGVGNIYANDGLWLAKIDPRTKANSLTLVQVKRLRESLCRVLEKGLATGGASDNTYRDFYGERGSYQDEFLVYGRTGLPCNRCGTPLKRIVVGGRGTWICPKCQG